MKKFLKINILYKNKPLKSLESVLELNIAKIRRKRFRGYKNGTSEKNLNLSSLIKFYVWIRYFLISQVLLIYCKFGLFLFE